MIRVNLLAGKRDPQRPRQSVASVLMIPLAGSLMVTAALIGGWRFWTVTRLEERLVDEIEAARREEARLTTAQTEVAAVEAQRSRLQQRLSLIGDLRRAQEVPVHIIDQISRSLPDQTWLTSLRQDGERVTLEGHCTSLSALADFIANLESTPQFKRPVEIVASETIRGQETVDLIRFTIRGTVSTGRTREPAPAAPGGTGG
jgi:type IV pilus assembly protein PilN